MPLFFKKYLLYPGLVLLVTSAAACNDYLFYHPTRQVYIPPEKLHLKYEDFYLKSADNKNIHAWLFPSHSVKARATLVQFHGNAQNISSHYLSLLWLTEYGYELFTFDYRGYGRSEGEPNTAKIIADARLLLQFLQERNRKKKLPLIIYGQSLGGILAVRTLGELRDRSLIPAIVIEGSFSSYRSIGKQVANRICIPLGYLSYLFVSDRYSVNEILPKLSPIHTIVIHGDQDTVVPISNGKNIYDLARRPKHFLEIPGGKHLDWHYLKHYTTQREKLLHLLEQAL